MKRIPPTRPDTARLSDVLLGLLAAAYVLGFLAAIEVALARLSY
jgi:hypothetical protein